MAQTLELLLEHDGATLFLRSPEVGFFSRALPQGALLAPRASAGVLHSLGRRFDLVAPPDAAGRVVNARPEAVLAPVGYGTVLYELEPLAAQAAEARARTEASSVSAGALVFRAPCAGRFWQRPSPEDPPFAKVGDLLVEGQPLGLIEVMKTFTQIVYRATGDLPPRARVLRFQVPDGGEVKDGGALLELERA